MKKQISIDNIYNNIMGDLKEFEPYTYHKAMTGSIYVKFKDSRFKSLRIADHTGRAKYSYKWNLTSKTHTQQNCGKYNRHYYNFADYADFINHFKNYANYIISLDNKEVV